MVNSRASKIGGIKILGSKISTDTTELTAVGLDADGKELGIDIAKDKFKWTLLSDPSQTSMFVSEGNESTVVMQQNASPFAVMAQLDLGSEQYLTDIYDSGIVRPAMEIIRAIMMMTKKIITRIHQAVAAEEAARFTAAQSPMR